MTEVKCPYCGTAMECERKVFDPYDETFDEDYAFRCPQCFAVSPLAETKEEAFALAMQRTLQKPLTLEEAKAMDVVWLEDNDKTHCIPALVCRYVDGDVFFRGQRSRVTPLDTDYGKRWRAWASEPTDEERSAAAWEN